MTVDIPEATGCISLPLDNLRIILAHSGTFQTVVGAEDVEGAALKIGKFESPVAIERPRAMIGYVGNSDIELQSNTGWASNGPMWLEIEIPVPDDFRPADDDIEETRALKFEAGGVTFTNQMGDIIAELKALAIDGTGKLAITRFVLVSIGYADPSENNGEQFWGISLVVDYRGM